MAKRPRPAAVLTAIVVALTAGGAVLAQGALAQLGLSEAAARTFLFDELKGATIHGRRSAIAIAGTRAFHKLPADARGPAATGLFAWARAYVDSPTFGKAYADLRQGTIPTKRPYAQTVDQAVKQQVDDLLAGVEQLKQAAASMPPADRATIMASVEQQEVQFRSPEFATMLRTNLQAERSARSASETAAAREADERYPADPRRLVARRLRQFMEATADANFSARTISLTGGADGIEFVDPADQERNWVWQLAVIAGRDATTAARAAAEAWLTEIER